MKHLSSAAWPNTGTIRMFSVRYSRTTTPGASGAASGGSTMSLAGGCAVGSGTTPAAVVPLAPAGTVASLLALCAKAPAADTMFAAVNSKASPGRVPDNKDDLKLDNHRKPRKIHSRPVSSFLGAHGALLRLPTSARFPVLRASPKPG